jgi:hypothetical protein
MLLEPLSARLRRLLGARPRPLDQARRDALEHQLLAEHRRRYAAVSSRSGQRPGSSWPALTLAARLAIASLALTVAGVAACQIPVDIALELGHRVAFELPVDDQAHARIEAIAQAIEDRAGVESIEVRIRGFDDAPTIAATLDIWGPALDLEVVHAILTEHGLAPEQVEMLPLAGNVRTTWGDRLGHDLFDLELDLESMNVVEARREILDQLEAQGFTGEAEVHVVDQGEGKRSVEIRLRGPKHDAGSHTPASAP